jgi:hypothetical protein
MHTTLFRPKGEFRLVRNPSLSLAAKRARLRIDLNWLTDFGWLEQKPSTLTVDLRII